MWRWSCVFGRSSNTVNIFSTYVEVIPIPSPVTQRPKNFLHVCGGDPQFQFFIDFFQSFSPRMWRWSSTSLTGLASWTIFSTYVEVILTGTWLTDRQSHFLHVCGGDPNRLLGIVFALINFLHVCGGDPGRLLLPIGITLFSPRMWRWSWWWSHVRSLTIIFSTYVEVILCLYFRIKRVSYFLHVCGGDPVRFTYNISQW